jgi:hypothetical protein
MRNIRELLLLVILASGSGASAATNVATLLNFDTDNGQLDLTWVEGFAPYQVQSRTSLVAGVWFNLGAPTLSRSYAQALPGDPVTFLRVLSSSSAATTAKYRVTFTSTWSAETHPTNFPSPSQHYSPLIGGTHNQDITFWEPGGTATPGMESMAETGSPSTLSAEVNAAISAGDAQYKLSGGGLGTSPGSVEMEFELSQGFPLVTLVSMIAPSPDWFIGVHDLNLFVDGDWVDSLSVSLLPYDAGTDDGISYFSGNADTNPQGVISAITGFPLEYEGSVAEFGKFIFTRIDGP